MLNCSASPPPDGVYLALMARKPSAKFLMALVSVLKVLEDEA